MLYPYITLGDGTEILHTGIKEKDGLETVQVHLHLIYEFARVGGAESA